MASLAGLLIGRGRKSQISGDFRDKLAKQSANFAVISQEFSGQTSPKRIRKKRPILWLFSRQISLEIDQFCADQTSVFNVFLTEIIILLFQQRGSRNEPMAKPLTLWLVPRSFGMLFAHFSDKVPRQICKFTAPK